MKLGLILLGTSAAALLASMPWAGSSPAGQGASVAKGCETDTSVFRTGFRMPARFASKPAEDADGVEMSFEYFCQCDNRASHCAWRSGTVLASVDRVRD